MGKLRAHCCNKQFAPEMNLSHRFRSLLVLTVIGFAIVGWPVANAADSDDNRVDDEVLNLIRPKSVVRLGAGHVDGNALRFGQYTGAIERAPVLLLDVDLATRDENTGTWFRLDANNLGLDYREFRLDHERQGAWKYYLDYSRTPRFIPLEFITGLAGADSELQQINGAPARPLEVGTVRDAVTIGLESFLTDAYETQLRFRQEEKTGQRPLGSGVAGTGPAVTRALTFFTEPIDSVSKEMEATLGYTGKDLQWLGGYLGSWFINHYQTVVANGAAIDDLSSVPLSLSPAQISLPPDNAAHQLYLSGGYSLSPVARATFKLSHERATQNESYPVLVAGSSRAANQQLDGEVDTSLVHAGLSFQASEALGLLASFRHEDRNDKTPVRQYLTPGANFPHSTNVRNSRTLRVGKAEATLRLTREHSITVGVDHDWRQRELPPSVPFIDPAAPAQARQVSAREETREQGYRLELRRALTQTVNGSLARVVSKRNGSSFLPADNNPSADFIAPIHWADREREKWRLAVDWIPAEPLSIQVVFEDAKDQYSGLSLGPRQGSSRLYSLDISYALSNDWQLTGWASLGKTNSEQATCGAFNPRDSFCTVAASWIQWQANLDEQSKSFGLGLRGSPTRKIKLGADLQYADERNGFGFAVLDASAVALPAGLPSGIYYKSANLVSFLEYAMRQHEGWRLDYVYQRVRTNDWTWDLVDSAGSSLYADGATVNLRKDASARLVGLSYFYRWR